MTENRIWYKTAVILIENVFLLSTNFFKQHSLQFPSKTTGVMFGKPFFFNFTSVNSKKNKKMFSTIQCFIYKYLCI